jgi:transglutaminase-like putative cysteine protease
MPMDEPFAPPPPDRPRDEARPVAASGMSPERAGPTLSSGAAPAAEAGEPEPWTLRRIVHAKPFVPTVVVVVLVCVVLLSSRLAGRPPVVDAITPPAGKPGEVMIITGRWFGRERGEVRIAGISPTSSDYSEWTDTRISVTIPEEAGSGLVHVVTSNGSSRGLLFINREEIPVVTPGPGKAGEPWVAAIEPLAAKIGDTITITGMNFGLEKGASEVYFAWTGGGGTVTAVSSDLGQLAPAREYNLDYRSWSDREIVLRVPDGAASGNVLVTTDKGRSNSVYFETLAGAGLKYFSRPRTTTVQYGVAVQDVASSGGNTLFLWLARVIQTPEQRKIQLVRQTPEPVVGEHNNVALFKLENLVRGDREHVVVAFMYERYQVETQVTASKVPQAYAATADLAARFTAADALVPAKAPEIVKAAATAAGAEKNPYLKARRIYEWMLGQISRGPTGRATDAVAVLKAKRGDAFAYSSLYCALLRAAKVPSRMVAGALVGDTGQRTLPHYWDEFYIETIGWIPVDPLLGDEDLDLGLPADPEVDRRAFYFGNLDNRHLTFSKGIDEVSRMAPDGRAVRRADFPWLASIHEEAVGGLASWTTTFDGIEVTGVY